MIDDLEEETGQSTLVLKCCYLYVLSDGKDVSIFQNSLKLQHSLELKTKLFSRDEVHRLATQCVFPDAIAGTLNANYGPAGPHNIVMGYIPAARRHGAIYLKDCSATYIESEKDKVQKVRTSLVTFEAETIINLLGTWNTFFGSEIALEIYVSALVRQWFVTVNIPKLLHIDAALKRIPLLINPGIKARHAILYEITPNSHLIIGSTLVKGFIS